MCFIITKDTKGPYIAEEDIICYKTGGSESTTSKFESMIQKFIYHKDEINDTIRLKPKKIVTSAIEKRFLGIRYCKYIKDKGIFEGYHAFKNYVKPITSIHYNIGKFIIPKNSIYFEDEIQYVSSDIIYKNLIPRV